MQKIFYSTLPLPSLSLPTSQQQQSMSFIKNNKRALCTGAALIMTVLFLVSLHQTSPGIASLNVAGSRTTGNIRYVDFDSSSNNSSSTQQERILVLTPLKDAVPYLDRYFELLDRTTYPNEQLSLAFLVSDSTDGTLERLQELADRIQHGTRPFHDIQIFHKDFHFELEPLERHKFEMQPYRRSIMARSRNLLLASALDTQVRWVAWVDADVIEYPPTIFEDLMSIDEDIVVPNCMLYPSKDLVVDDWAYDKNNWRETPQSLAFQQSLDPDFVLAEGYKELETGRQLVSRCRSCL